MKPHIRPRRLRSHGAIRDLVQEHRLFLSDLVQPLFIIAGQKQKIPLASMPGQFRFSLDKLLNEVEELIELGLSCVSLFPILTPDLKTKEAEESYNPHGLVPTAVRGLKKHFPDLLVMTDVAMDPYSSDGHDGYWNDKTRKIDNDKTLDILARMALVQAQAGADILGPSDMMDHRVGFIRRALDKNGFYDVAIMSYTSKYCSAFYGPFREALNSAPLKGDKKTYQMNPGNIREAVLEAKLDESEGADILMVKPGLAYLDVLRELRHKTSLPLAVYNVSGEYSMVKAAAARGFIDENHVVSEILLSFKRAGANVILTYFAKDEAQKIRDLS